MFSVRRCLTTGLVLILTFIISSAQAPLAEAKETIRIRVGYFPNITHAQALIGLADGTFQKELGSNVKIEAVAFNAGPAAMEALFAGSIDLTYIGPNPAINGYVKSNGKALKIVAGATSGGASLVVRGDSGIKTAKDLAGKRIATPQLGNTQDVALRNYLADNGLKPKERGGSVEVTPVANPDQLTLFKKKEIDGAWAPEPWATRLIKEAGGRLFIDERRLWPKEQFTTAHIVVSTKFLKENPDVVKAWIRAHVKITRDINKNPAKALKVINSELKRLTGKALPDDVLKDAFSRMDPTWDPICGSLIKSAESAFDAGFLGTKKPDLSDIYDLMLLNEVLKEMKLPLIKGL